ncbi:uncharacterized protein LOC135206088 isoform X2 [Macrobrachium nipponense]|uniref:uncharacterized protein LOC135206088 isoform X2 n=1 Tax=Macrobrachium nipponense TaxID=159736 RepID=UPI0030C83062
MRSISAQTDIRALTSSTRLPAWQAQKKKKKSEIYRSPSRNKSACLTVPVTSKISLEFSRVHHTQVASTRDPPPPPIPMEQRSAQEMTTLQDVAYVVCYGHFPESGTRGLSNPTSRPTKDIQASSTGGAAESVGPPAKASPESPSSSPDSTFDEGHAPPDEANPFAEDEDNPFSDEGNTNPFDDEDKGRDEEETNPFAEDTNPFGEDDPYGGGDERPPPEDGDSKQNDATTITGDASSPTASPTTETSIPDAPPDQTDSAPSTPSATPQDLPNPLADPNSPLATAMKLSDKKRVSPSHAKEIIAEAFNVTKLDLNRLVEDTRNTKVSPTAELLLEEIRTEGLPVSPPSETYPILFLRARVGQEEKFTNFSSTSATNTIEQSLTLTIQNMYNDVLTMEVWSANVLPLEDPQTPPKLDLLGRIMTGSMRRKREDSRSAKMMKNAKPNIEEHQPDTEREISPDTPRQTPSPKPSQEDPTDKIIGVTSELQNGDAVDHESPHSQSLDNSDSISVSSEMSNDPIKTSTPRGRSSSLQHLEATNLGDSSPKKGFRSSFRKKAGHFLRSSHSNLRKSNQSLNTTDSASPDLSRKPSDAHSMQSECNEVSYQESKLDREHSKSSLSISSLTKRTFSMRLSSKKASGQMKRFASVRARKKDAPDGAVPYVSEPNTPNQHRHQLQNESPEQTDGVTSQPVEQSNLSQNHVVNSETMSPKPISKGLLTPRPMRPFRNLKALNINNDTKSELVPVSPTKKSPTEKKARVKMPNNPEEIQQYLTRIGKDHLQAERIAYANVPLKGTVRNWVKEGWIPMTIVLPNVTGLTTETGKKKKTKKQTTDETDATAKSEKEAKVLCKMHVKLALPVPMESELNSSAFESYNSTYTKLVNLKVRTMDDLTDYKGDVGVVGDILLDQLIFFSRVSVWHQELVSWLVLADKKPSDPTLLLPFLLAIKNGLQEGQYVTAQKLKMGESLSKWVRYIMPNEFETLHSSFPCNSHLLHLPRLEHFLRCFNTIEEDTDLKILFEREMNLINLPSLTEQLKGALMRHAEIWIEALNKEPLNQESNVNLEGVGTTADDAKWYDDLRRAAHLSKPIDDFLVICVYTYQPIFMTEMSVDYLYWVLPKFLTASLHLIMKTHNFPVSKIRSMPKGYIPLAAQAAWKICSNISGINKISIESKLPIHLIEQDFRTAYSNTVLQWLTLSVMLSLQEMENDFQQEEFVAIDPVKGYSHSAVSMVDILKAIMSRLQGLSWPGGIRPGVNTLTRIAKQIVMLVKFYTDKITSTYTTRDCNTGRIPTEACVVVRNVEHVCDEARQHLTTLASWAEEMQVQEELPPDEEAEGLELQLEGRNQKLQEQIDSAAQRILQKCLPDLEVILKQGVSANKPDYVIETMVSILQPIEDRLYFAESLLFELWNRIFKEAENFMLRLQQNTFPLQGQWRSDLRRLEKSLSTIYSFLTDTEKVGFQLPDEAVQEYEKLIDHLKMSGASSPALVAMYYNERYFEQCKEVDAKTTNVIITNVTFSKDGLKVYIAQAPGNARGGVLIKARVEPQEWFPNAMPQKTRLVKAEQAVFDETLNFYEVHHDGPHNETEENSEGGGVLILQVRTPKLFMGSVVHCEAIVPLATVPRVNDDTRHTVQHLRLPLTRPWSSKNYKALRTLKTRTQDACAGDFLKVWHARWEGADEASMNPESIKANPNFIRATGLRLSSRRRSSLRDASVK